MTNPSDVVFEPIPQRVIDTLVRFARECLLKGAPRDHLSLDQHIFDGKGLAALVIVVSGDERQVVNMQRLFQAMCDKHLKLKRESPPIRPEFREDDSSPSVN